MRLTSPPWPRVLHKGAEHESGARRYATWAVDDGCWTGRSSLARDCISMRHGPTQANLSGQRRGRQTARVGEPSWQMVGAHIVDEHGTVSRASRQEQDSW